MQKLPREMKKEILGRLARGEDLKYVAETLQIDPQCARRIYLQYLALPMGEKLKIAPMPELITNRAHRLADDIKDINRIDALLAETDVKTLVALLDMKRKIKERMLKDSASSCEAAPYNDDDEMDEVLAECYERVFGKELQTANEHS